MQWHSLDYSTRVIVKVILAGLGLAFLWVVRDIVIMLLLAVVLASAMEPLVGYLKIRRVPRTVSVLAVYVIVLGIATLVISLLLPVAIQQAQVLNVNLPQYTAQFEERFPSIQAFLGNTDLNEIIKTGIVGLTSNSSVYSQTIGVVNGLFSLITVLVVSFYLVAEQQGMINFINSLVPAGQRKIITGLVRKIQNRMGLWILGQLILSVCVFILTFLGLSALGVEYALFLALLAGIFEIVPYLGPLFSAVPAVFFAFVQNPPLAVAVIILYVIVQKVEAYVLVPKVMQRTVGTSPLLVLVALLVGYKLAGIVGLLLAIPIVSVITLLVEEFSSSHQTEKAIENIP